MNPAVSAMLSKYKPATERIADPSSTPSRIKSVHEWSGEEPSNGHDTGHDDENDHRIDACCFKQLVNPLIGPQLARCREEHTK